MPRERLYGGMSALVYVSMLLALVSGAWAKPKFKILLETSSGYFTGPLTLDSQGNLYGVSSAGGAYNEGTVFKLSPGANGKWTQTVLASFDGTDGYLPNGGLVFDGQGNLYGTARGSTQQNEGGTLFEVSPGSNGWELSLLYAFCLQYHCPDGGGPWAGVVMDSYGNLYGTAEGGEFGDGVVYELTPGSGGWTETSALSFGGADGATPYDQLIFDTSGNLYGTTAQGGKYSGGHCCPN